MSDLESSLLSASSGEEEERRGASRVAGRIWFEHRLPAADIEVLAYSRGFGGEDTLLKRGTTDSRGMYSLDYPPPDGPVNLEIRTLDRAGKEISLSKPKYGAGTDETLDLVAPASIARTASEYDRLVSDVERALGQITRLGDAKERDGRHDLTILARATGWDARLLSFAATSTKLAAETGVPADALYGLIRAGLPADDTLFRVHPEIVDKAWRKAAAAGVINGRSGDVAVARNAAFRARARAAFTEAKAPGAASSYGELLATADLNDDERAAFEDAYLSGASGPDLWRAAKKQGVSAESVDKLRLQGRLALLTRSNAPLIAALQADIATHDDLSGLVDQGLYRAEAWKGRITAVADEGQLGALIPPAIGGDQTSDRLDAYAADMARQVRLAFPTHVVSHMLEQGDLPVPGGAEVGAVLRRAAARGFELGRTPVDAFFAESGEDIVGPDADGAAASMLERVRTVARMYQITPGNEAMKTLLAAGFTSAHDVVAVDPGTFVSRYEPALGSDADLVYRKAVQAVSVTQAVVASARVLESPAVRAISGDAHRHRETTEAAKEELVKHYPTMEQLFGSLDFCECEHCRSVLSPAAYLVDLLRFLDPQQPWNDFVKSWNASHDAKFGAGGAYDKPYDQLVKRRSDVPNLPLTCENTNTVMPYIDLVNEILEYYVANQTYEGHDTADATSPELLAEPQYVLPQAYATLSGARYPLGLPFDLWLETVRAYLVRLGVPLHEVLETFRPTDALFPTPNDTSPYFRYQVFAESVGLTPAEWALFTSGATASWWTLYGYASAAEAEAALASAKTLARRLDVSYRQLTDLVRTAFVNPGLTEILLLSKLGIGLDEVYRFKGTEMTDPERAEFQAVLDEFKGRTKFDAKKWLDERHADGTFDRVLVLAAPAVECNFDQTLFQYAGGKKAAVIDFVKLNFFVRLWKKLGWTIDELDHVLTAFVPARSRPLTETNLGVAMGTALIYVAHLNTIATMLPVQGALSKLPALWTDISTTGRNSLYARLFLTRTVLKDDPIFDEPTGKYLSDNRRRLVDHRSAVQAALTLSASDLDRVAADAGIALDTTPPPGPTPPRARLSVSNLSKLYRYRLLSVALGLTIDDLITLKSLSGLDPFAPLALDPLDPNRPPAAGPSTLADDHPFGQTLRFIELARVVAATELTVEEIDYLVRHHIDPAGPYRADPSALLAFVFELGAGIARIRSENTAPEDPAALDDETLRQQLALVLPAEAVETFMGMWRGTIQYEATAPNIAAAGAIDRNASPFDPASKPYAAEVTIEYDAARSSQRLVFSGFLMPDRKDELAPNPGLLRSLLDDVQAQARGFARAHLAELFPETGNDDFTDVDDTFEPVPAAASDARTVLARKRRRIAERLFPLVRQHLTRHLVVTTGPATAGVDATLVEALLTDKALLTDGSQGDPPLLDAFSRAADQGVSVSFYASGDGTGATLSRRDVAEVDTTERPPTAHSAHIEGAFAVPTSGLYRFFVNVDSAGTRAELRLAHVPEPVVAVTSANADYETSVEVDLRAAVPYSLVLDVGWPTTGNASGDVTLSVQGGSLAKGPLSRLPLHPASAVERVRRADVLLAKAMRVVSAFALDERELRHLVTHPGSFDSAALSALPTIELGSAGATANFTWLARIAHYAALKSDIGLSGDDLIGIFENAQHAYDPVTDPATAEAALLLDLHTRVAELLRRNRADVEGVANLVQFGAEAVAATQRVEAPKYADERGLRRLWDALRTLDSLGVSPDSVADLTRIIDPATAAGRDSIARDVRNALKAQVPDDAWLLAAQPISDELRRRKRDALVAYVVADPQHDFEHPDELYEFFLIDPATEPAVQTSRLQLAISAVQQFVQRCLLNLEPRVPAAAIGMGDASPWDWMKRYRTWEANRKIFLYPENWLEPEFRDGKTHLFTELEGSLLKGEISNESAEDAFVAFLAGLENIARLELVSAYAEAHPSDPGTTMHLIGRTSATPHKYFYRRHAYGAWTPWEPVDVDVEGDHVVAVIWRNRLHLFWLTFHEKGDLKVSDATATTTAGDKPDDLIQRRVEVRLSWSEYVKGRWTGLSAGKSSAVMERDVPPAFDRSKVYAYVATKPIPGGDDALLVCIVGGYDVGHDPPYSNTVESQDWIWNAGAFRLATKNGSPTVLVNEYDQDIVPRSPVHPYLGLNTHFDATLRVAQHPELWVAYGWPDYSVLNAAPFPVSSTVPFSALSIDNFVEEPAVVPFFYEDEQHTFFIEPVTLEPEFIRRDGWGSDGFQDLNVIDSLVLEAAVPELKDEPRPPEPLATFTIKPNADWVDRSGGVARFDGVAIGSEGVISQERIRVEGPDVSRAGY